MTEKSTHGLEGSNDRRFRDTEPPFPRDERPPAPKPAILSLRDLRRIKGIEHTDIAARTGWAPNKVIDLEALELRLLEVEDLCRYVEALGMRLTMSVDLLPNAPLVVLSTR